MRILERLIPGRTPVQLGKKLIFDQGIFTPPLIAAFFTINERKRKPTQFTLALISDLTFV